KPLHDGPIEFLRHCWFWLFVTPADLPPLVAHDAAKIAFVGEYEFVPQWRRDAIVAVILSFVPTVADKRCEFTDNEVLHVERVPVSSRQQRTYGGFSHDLANVVGNSAIIPSRNTVSFPKGLCARCRRGIMDGQVAILQTSARSAITSKFFSSKNRRRFSAGRRWGRRTTRGWSALSTRTGRGSRA